MSNTVQSLLDETFALQHYGVKGQKWGVRNYQNPDGTYTEEGKKRRRVGYKKDETSEEDKVKIAGKAYKDMTRKERRAAKRKARHNEAERRERREFNRDKAEAMERGDLDFVTKHLEKFTNEEIQQVVNRYNTMQIVRDLDAKDKARKHKNADHYIDKAIHYLTKAADVTEQVTKIRDYINKSNKTAEEAKKTKAERQKSELAYDQAKNPEKYDKKKTKDELEKDALEMQKARDAARKAKADADKAEQDYRKTMLEADEKDPEVKKAREALEKARQAVIDADYNVAMTEKSHEDDKQWLKDQKKQEKQRKKEEKRRQKEQEDDDDTYSTIAETNDFINAWRDKLYNDSQSKKDKKKDKKEDKVTYYQPTINLDDDDHMKIYNDWNYGKTASQKRSIIERVLGSDKIKDYSSYKPSKNHSYDLDDLNKESQKALKKIDKASKSTKSKYGDYDSDKRMYKDMKKHDSDVIDDWVKDMKKKYMKERGMSAEAAEAKAEDYVDAWLDAYDEGKIKF